jgi:hypothetical protein
MNKVVIASEAKQSRGHTEGLDRFVTDAPRNDAVWSIWLRAFDGAIKRETDRVS